MEAAGIEPANDSDQRRRTRARWRGAGSAPCTTPAATAASSSGFLKRASSAGSAPPAERSELRHVEQPPGPVSWRKRRTPAPSSATGRRSASSSSLRRGGPAAGSADPYPGTSAIGRKRGKLARLPPSEPPDRAPRRQSKQSARQARWYVRWGLLSSKQFRGFSSRVPWAKTPPGERRRPTSGRAAVSGREPIGLLLPTLALLSDS